MDEHLENLRAQLSLLNSIYEFSECKHERAHIDWLRSVIQDHILRLNEASFMIIVDDEVRKNLAEMRESINNLISHFDLIFQVLRDIKDSETKASKLSQINWISTQGIDITGLQDAREKTRQGFFPSLDRFFNRVRWLKARVGTRLSWVASRAYELKGERDVPKKKAFEIATKEWNEMVASIGDY